MFTKLSAWVAVISASFMMFANPVFAATSFTPEEVALHDSSSDCWMIFEDNVYDFSDYLPLHVRMMDISPWCGTDMTEAFITKAGIGRDHRSSSYTMLENYYIGKVEVSSGEISNTTDSNTNDSGNSGDTTGTDISSFTDQSAKDSDGSISAGTQAFSQSITSEYRILIPILLSCILYGLSFLGTKVRKSNNKPIFSLILHNAIWNTLLVLSMILSFIFGLCYVLAFKIPAIATWNFDYSWWHVELGTSAGIISLLHFTQRLRPFIAQIRHAVKRSDQF